jgi:hypothetical protein
MTRGDAASGLVEVPLAAGEAELEDLVELGTSVSGAESSAAEVVAGAALVCTARGPELGKDSDVVGFGGAGTALLGFGVGATATGAGAVTLLTG